MTRQTPTIVIRDFWFPLDIHMSPSISPRTSPDFNLNLTICTECSFYELSSLTSSLWRRLLIRLGACSLDLGNFSPLPEIFTKLQKNRVSSLHQLWNEAYVSYIDLMPTKLCMNILMMIYLLLMLVSFDHRWICCSFWLDCWQHLFFFRLNSRHKGLLSLKSFSLFYCWIVIIKFIKVRGFSSSWGNSNFSQFWVIRKSQDIKSIWKKELQIQGVELMKK